jgi:predicted DNA-binding transcriptional regulator AlpA
MAKEGVESARKRTVRSACVSAEEAFEQLGIDRTTGYRAIQRGTFPLPTIRVGRVIRVPAAALRHLLVLDDARYHSTEVPDGDAPDGPTRPSLALEVNSGSGNASASRG